MKGAGRASGERAHHQHADAGHRASRESRHRRVEIRRGGDHRLVGDADRGRAQRRRFDQPAAADLGPPRSRRSRPTAFTRSATAASSISGASSSRCWCSRSAPEFRSMRASSTSSQPEPAVSPLIAYRGAPRRLPARRRIDPRRVPGIPGRQGRARLVPGGAAVEGPARRSSSCSRMARRWPESSSPPSASPLSQLTGNPFFDGAASVVIGLILGADRLAARRTNRRRC